jgi:hypothetical protein
LRSCAETLHARQLISADNSSSVNHAFSSFAVISISRRTCNCVGHAAVDDALGTWDTPTFLPRRWFIYLLLCSPCQLAPLTACANHLPDGFRANGGRTPLPLASRSSACCATRTDTAPAPAFAAPFCRPYTAPATSPADPPASRDGQTESRAPLRGSFAGRAADNCLFVLRKCKIIS